MIVRAGLREALAMALFCGSTSLSADDWLGWRGSRHDDVSTESSGWNGERWLSEAPSWTIETGRGATAPIAAGDRVWTFGRTEHEEQILCLEARDGRVLWRQAYEAPERGRYATGDESFYDGPSATPSLDPATDSLLTLGIDGQLKAWSATSGDKRWEIDLYEKYAADQRPRVGRQGRRDYGYTGSPLILGDAAIVEVGSPDGNLMAFALNDGRRLWKSESTDPAGHSGGPVPITVEGRQAVAVLTLHGLIVVRAEGREAGATLATFPWETDFGNNIPTPTVIGNQVLITSKYNRNAMVKLRIDRSGATEVWRSDAASGVCSPIVRDGRIWIAEHRIHAVDLATGRTIFSGGRLGDAGSGILTADDKLIVWGGKGTLSLIDVSPDLVEFRELDRREFDAPSDTWPHVVLSNGRLLLRTREGTLHCYATIGSAE
ncbi:MAG TPA: hypothetical protein DCQ98_21630 [Planctomycetaceae bacterium]|nr:hypothetical protein [Planctomycetaceae bacterium]